jgi:type II secretory pathway pseudopilin PulG
MRRGLSMLELVVAFAVLMVGVASILESLSTAKDQAVRLDVLSTGRMLAQSVMEQAQERLAVEGSRFARLDAPVDQVRAKLAAGDWKKPFEALRQQRTGVMEPGGAANPYFDPQNGPLLPGASEAPDELPLWQALSYEVRVGFDVRVRKEQAPVAIDADGDGVGENDVARLDVEVFFQPDAAKPPQSVCLLTTLVAAPDRIPGAGKGAP